MTFTIRNKQAQQVATELAKLTGETTTQAVTQALRERLERAQRNRAKHRLSEEIEKIARHCAALPILDARDADDLIDYDPHGIPR